MTFLRSDELVIHVVARELEALGKVDPNPRNTAAVAAQLLATLFDTPLEVDERKIDCEALSLYLSAKGLIPAGAVVELSRTAQGFSKDTFIVRVAGLEDTAENCFVLRRDLVASAVRSTVVTEFPLLTGLYHAGFPVAEPLLLETDPDVLHQPFILTRMLAGESGHGVGLASPQESKDIGYQLADLLARLHGFAPADVAADQALVRQSPQDVLRDHFATWRAIYAEVGGDTMPVVSRAFDWLASVPVAPARLSLVHGDVDFPNMLVSGGKVSGVIDWEFAHWGDSAEDLGYVRAAVEKRMDWTDFLDRYCAQGGSAPSEEALRFYQLWRALRTTTTCLLARQAFDSGKNTDMRMAFAGRIILCDWVARVERISAELL